MWSRVVVSCAMRSVTSASCSRITTGTVTRAVEQRADAVEEARAHG